MTPQLQQAIKLLQLSNLDLTAYVEQELEKNPLLERAEPSEDAPDRGSDADAPTVDTGEVVAADAKIAEDKPASDAEAVLDTDYENVYAEDSASDAAIEPGPAPSVDWGNGKGGSTSFDGGGFSLEDTLSEAVTLKEHLTEQLHMAVKDPSERMIGAYLIDMTDEAGYLNAELDQVAERLGTDLFGVECVLGVLQTFDPQGVMARNLQECLAVQLADMDRLDPAMKTLLENLDLLAQHDMAKICEICRVDGEDLAEMIQDIRRCNPKPGLAFGTDIVQPVVPDVYVRRAQDGAWTIELNSETLPRVLVNARYYAEVSKNVANTDKTYLTECLNDANWLVKSLDQRARTILKVSTEIVRQQDAFLAKGIQHLRPLNLKTIAEAISMHESTVSRVTANKYMATARGVFELKYFFTSAIASSEGGEAHSAEAVRHRIRGLIDNEPVAKVLSDDKIVDLLKESGIEIARRTVAKYREAMRIPSSVQRRRQKKAMAS
jgi:RNA polymerase sigma-54 factor